MKRILLLATLITVASTQMYATTKPATTTKPVTTTTSTTTSTTTTNKVTTPVITVVNTTIEKPEVKTEKGKVLSQISGIVVFESDIFRSKNKPKSDLVIGDIDTDNEDSTDKEENNGEKMPKGTIELGAKVFENYDVRLKLNSTKSTAEDTSTFSVSRT